MLAGVCVRAHGILAQGGQGKEGGVGRTACVCAAGGVRIGLGAGRITSQQKSVETKLEQGLQLASVGERGGCFAFRGMTIPRVFLKRDNSMACT